MVNRIRSIDNALFKVEPRTKRYSRQSRMRTCCDIMEHVYMPWNAKFASSVFEGQRCHESLFCTPKSVNIRHMTLVHLMKLWYILCNFLW